MSEHDEYWWDALAQVPHTQEHVGQQIRVRKPSDTPKGCAHHKAVNELREKLYNLWLKKVENTDWAHSVVQLPDVDAHVRDAYMNAGAMTDRASSRHALLLPKARLILPVAFHPDASGCDHAPLPIPDYAGAPKSHTGASEGQRSVMARRFQDWRSLPVMPVTEADRSVILGCKVEVVLGTPIIIEPLSAIIGERAGVDDEEFMSLLHGKLRAQAPGGVASGDQVCGDRCEHAPHKACDASSGARCPQGPSRRRWSRTGPRRGASESQSATGQRHPGTSGPGLGIGTGFPPSQGRASMGQSISSGTSGGTDL